MTVYADNQAKPTVYIEVTTDKKEGAYATYEVGEEVRFHIQAFECKVRGNQAIKAEDAEPVTGKKLKYKIVSSGGFKKTGEIVSDEKPVTVTAKLDKPGFILCEVNEKTLPKHWQYREHVVAAVDPLKINELNGYPANRVKPTVYIEVTPATDDAIYATGEEVRFNVQAFPGKPRGTQAIKVKNAEPVVGKKLKYEITGSGGFKKTGELVSAEEPVSVTAKLDRPGMLMCSVHEKILSHWWQYRGRCGAAIDPLKIKPGVTKPKDFDEFWQESLAELEKHPVKPVSITEIEPKNSKDQVGLFKVKLSAPGAGTNDFNPYVCGYLCKPKGTATHRYPAMLSLPGAGLRDPNINPHRTAARGIIQFSILVHGYEVGHDSQFYRKQKGYKGKRPDMSEMSKVEARRLSYYRTMFLRVAQALRYLKSLPEWDGETLITSGGSQGGGLSLIAASLDSDVTACIACFPGFCDQYGYRRGQKNGWPQMIKLNKKTGKPVHPLQAEIAAYFDAVNFARTLHADCLLTTGFVDTTCPPVTAYAAYNVIPAENKRIITDPNTGHHPPPGFQKALDTLLEKHTGSE